MILVVEAVNPEDNEGVTEYEAGAHSKLFLFVTDSLYITDLPDSVVCVEGVIEAIGFVGIHVVFTKSPKSIVIVAESAV